MEPLDGMAARSVKLHLEREGYSICIETIQRSVKAEKMVLQYLIFFLSVYTNNPRAKTIGVSVFILGSKSLILEL